MKRENVVEILYTDDCPFWRETLKLIKEVINDMKTEVMVKKVKISSEDEAKRLKLLGSPTVRINGVDIDSTVKEAVGYIGCRIYRYKGRIYEFPPKELIESAFERLLRR